MLPSANRDATAHPTTARIINTLQNTAGGVRTRASRDRTPDLCVIGAGSGGLSVAAAAAALGVSVVLIEKHKMGGDCLNTGCVPSKALIAVAKRAYQIRTSASMGIRAREPEIDFKHVRSYIQGVIGKIAPNDSVARFEAMGVEVIQAAGRFVDKSTVEAGDVLVRARRFVVATGSSPSIPTIPGLNDVPYLTNESIFNLDQPVGHLIVVGGGAIGVELAQAYRRLGARVSIVEDRMALAKDDPELTLVALRCLRAEGITILENAKVDRVTGRPGAIEVHAGDTRIVGTHLLVATGRKPNVDGLGLLAAGIKSGPRGIEVGSSLRTSNRRVYAIGDVTGAQFTHVANHHAGIVVRRALFRLPARVKVDQLPRVTFTDPEIAQVGLTETEARAAHGKVVIYRWPYLDNDRAVADHVENGLIKVVCDKRGIILGAGIVGAQAGELIQLWSLALSRGLNIKAMTNCISPYPTLGEISKRAAYGALASDARRPAVQKLLALLRKFG